MVVKILYHFGGLLESNLEFEILSNKRESLTLILDTLIGHFATCQFLNFFIFYLSFYIDYNLINFI